MIKKLRLKFVLYNMIIVFIMLGIILGMVMFFTSKSNERAAIEMMRSSSMMPGGPRAPQDRPDDVRLPTFTINENDGAIEASGNGYYDLSDTEFLQTLVERVKSENKENGVIKEYNLRYLKVGRDIVFADMTMEKSTAKALLKTSILIFIVAIAVFFVISLVMANWAVKPVEEAWKQQKQFVADASHDLKTPLTVIMTNAEMLPDSNLKTGISKMAKEMRGLIENMLEMAKIDAQVTDANYSEISLSDVCENEIMNYEPLFFENGLILKGDIEKNIKIKGVEGQLNRVIDILLDNAQKYCYDKTETTLSLKSDRKYCILSVSDYGDAISDEDMDNIFKRFYKTDKARGMQQSYGLGLAIAEGIVTNHKGRIWAESKDGKNVFFVKLLKYNM